MQRKERLNNPAIALSLGSAVAVLVVAGCSSGSHGSGHVGSIPQDDFRNAPISSFGPGSAIDWSSGPGPGSGPGTGGNPGPLPPGTGDPVPGKKSGTRVRIGGSRH